MSNVDRFVLGALLTAVLMLGLGGMSMLGRISAQQAELERTVRERPLCTQPPAAPAPTKELPLT